VKGPRELFYSIDRIQNHSLLAHFLESSWL